MHKSNALRKLLMTFTVSILLTYSQNFMAQITIGSDRLPRVGALLDLKENNDLNANSTKGLLLPRVNLQRLTTLVPEKATFSGDEAHTALTVYNLKRSVAEDLCPGVYTWSGSTWIKLGGKKCLCEYTFVRDDNQHRYIYCKDFKDITINAFNVCPSNATNNNDYNYSLIKSEDFLQLWNKKSEEKPESSFDDDTYFINHNTWVTKAFKKDNEPKVLGVGFSFPGGPAIGGYIEGSSTIKCQRN